MAGREQSDKLEDGVAKDRDPAEDLDQLVTWYEQYSDNTQANRVLANRDVQYVHHKQWTQEEKDALEKRHQPVVTFNRIAPKVNFIRGYETRSRVDPKVKPRTPVHHDEAVAATDALRYSADTADFDGRRSIVTAELLVPGVGGVVLGVNDDRDITMSPVRADRIVYDPHSIEPDFSDARFLGVVLWWDRDDALDHELYGERPEVIEASLNEAVGHTHNWDPHEDKPSVWSDPPRKRLRIVEMYFKRLAPALDADLMPIVDADGKPKKRKEWHVGHFTKAGFLVDPKIVPWRDDKGHTFCPLIATSAFVDEENNRYGIVRGMISPQDEFNKRRSRALWETISRRFMFEEGAIDDPDTVATEFAKADGKIKVNEGALNQQDGPRIQILPNTGATQEQLALYQDAKQEIDNVGPSMPVIAGDNSTLSGRAILAKQNIGSMELEAIFDNLRRWSRRVFTCMWWMIRRIWTQEKWLRIDDNTQKVGYRFIAINREMTRGEHMLELVREGQVPIESAIYSVGLQPIVAQRLLAEAQQATRLQAQQLAQTAPQLQQMPPQVMQKQMEQMVLAFILQSPLMSEMMRMNDIAQVNADIIIEMAPDTTIAAEEEYAEMMEMLNKGAFNIPNVEVLKALILNSNLRNKEALIKAFDKPPDPQAVQFQQQQMQLQLQLLGTSVQKMQAEVQRLGAAAMRDMAEAQITAPAEAQRSQATSRRTAAQTLRDTVQAQVGIPAQAERSHAAAVRDIATAQAQVTHSNNGVQQ